MNKCLWQVFTKFSLQEVEVFNNKCTLMSVLGFDVIYQWSLKTLLVYIFLSLGKYSKWGCSMNKPQNLQERAILPIITICSLSGDGWGASMEGLYSIKIMTKPSKTIAPSPFHDMTLVIKTMCQRLLWL